MECLRCRGLMVEDHFIDLYGTGGLMWMKGWRCLNCGQVVDPLIEANRRVEAATFRAMAHEEPGHEDEDVRGQANPAFGTMSALLAEHHQRVRDARLKGRSLSLFLSTNPSPDLAVGLLFDLVGDFGQALRIQQDLNSAVRGPAFFPVIARQRPAAWYPHGRPLRD